MMTTMTRTLTTSGLRAAGAVRPAGFTLLEMMVVVGLVALMASMALPSIIALFDSGADAQAYNIISAQLTAARAKAVVSSTFDGIHVQFADALDASGGLLRPELSGVSFSGLIAYDSQNKWFDLMTAPQRIPGKNVFGYASQEVTGTNKAGIACRLDATIGNDESAPFVGGGNQSGVADKVEKFTTFSVIFNPIGAVTRFVNGDPIHFNEQSQIFSDTSADVAIYGSKRLWRMTTANDAANNYVQDRYGATAITMFDITEYASASSKQDYLKDNAQLLPLNVHTGQLYPRK